MVIGEVLVMLSVCFQFTKVTLTVVGEVTLAGWLMWLKDFRTNLVEFLHLFFVYCGL